MKTAAARATPPNVIPLAEARLDLVFAALADRGRQAAKEEEAEMKYEEAAKRVDSLHKQVVAMNEEIAQVRRSAEPQAMKDYVFTRSTGDSATWQDLLGGKKDLMVIHNMG